jgi:hypothetical protein
MGRHIPEPRIEHPVSDAMDLPAQPTRVGSDLPGDLGDGVPTQKDGVDQIFFGLWQVLSALLDHLHKPPGTLSSEVPGGQYVGLSIILECSHDLIPRKCVIRA